MQFEFFMNGKNLMVKVPGEEKAVTPFEVLMLLGMASKKQLAEKFGETKPELVVNEGITDEKSLKIIEQVKKEIDKIYS